MWECDVAQITSTGTPKYLAMRIRVFACTLSPTMWSTTLSPTRRWLPSAGRVGAAGVLPPPAVSGGRLRSAAAAQPGLYAPDQLVVRELGLVLRG